MTESLHPEIALYWNDSLGEELLHFLTKRLKCSDTAAEITHETYIRLCQTSQTNPPDNARTLAYRIAVNLAIDYQRKAKFRSNHTADMDMTALTEDFPDTAAGPEEQIAIAQQRLKILLTALAELPTDCRTAFLLRGMDGLTYPEIATHMGISVSMVGKHLARAMAHCAQQVKEQP